MFDNLPECTTWQCINSFALWISSVGTVLISTASLYVAHKAFVYSRDKDVPKIDIKIHTGLMGIADETLDFIGIEIINSGHKKVVVTGYSWEYMESFKKWKQLISYIGSSKQNLISDKIPCTLGEGEKADFYNPLNLFIENEIFHKNSNKLFVWYRIQTLKVRVSCSTFRKTIPVRKDLKSLIWRQYKNAVKNS